MESLGRTEGILGDARIQKNWRGTLAGIRSSPRRRAGSSGKCDSNGTSGDGNCVTRSSPPSPSPYSPSVWTGAAIKISGERGAARDEAITQRDELAKEKERLEAEIQKIDIARQEKQFAQQAVQVKLDQLNDELNKTVEAGQKADEARRASEWRATAAVQREGLDEITRGHIPQGLLRLSAAWSLAPPDARDLVQPIRLDIGASVPELHSRLTLGQWSIGPLETWRGTSSKWPGGPGGR